MSSCRRFGRTSPISLTNVPEHEGRAWMQASQTENGAEQAGRAARTRTPRIHEVAPAEIHQHVPVILGSKAEVPGARPGITSSSGERNGRRCRGRLAPRSWSWPEPVPVLPATDEFAGRQGDARAGGRGLLHAPV